MQIFTRRNGDNLEEIYKTNKKLFPLFVKIKKNDERTQLSFSKTNGDYLYALCDTEFDDEFEMLKNNKFIKKDHQKTKEIIKEKEHVEKKLNKAICLALLKK